MKILNTNIRITGPYLGGFGIGIWRTNMGTHVKPKSIWTLCLLLWTWHWVDTKHEH